MSKKRWLERNTESLVGKTIAVTGSTGGLGKALCAHLAGLGASLVLVDRNAERSLKHKEKLEDEYGISVTCVKAELESITQVNTAAELLVKLDIDVLILNAGAYSIPRHTCDTGFDNVFQINYVSQYTLAKKLLPHLKEKKGKVVAVGSIAHRYSKTDERDVDFSTRKSSALAYGNSKRYLMYSLYELFEDESDATLCIVHPGITLTNITAHYPKFIFAIIKHPMKIIFPSPEKASLCILKGVFDNCKRDEWIGPRIFDIWGYPKKKRLRHITEAERANIALVSRQI